MLLRLKYATFKVIKIGILHRILGVGGIVNYKILYYLRKKKYILCKVVIYKFVFCWLLFRAKFDCNYFCQFFRPLKQLN